MITILYTYLTIQALCSLYILYPMVTTKPTFYKGNRIVGNWKEGGRHAFYSSIGISIFLTTIVVFIMLVGAVLNFLTK